FIRVHAAYISEQESARLASFLRKQGKPVYDETITAEAKTAADGIEFEKDDLYDEAARIVVSSGQASISYLQRRLRIGFSRAARADELHRHARARADRAHRAERARCTARRARGRARGRRGVRVARPSLPGERLQRQRALAGGPAGARCVRQVRASRRSGRRRQ